MIISIPLPPDACVWGALRAYPRTHTTLNLATSTLYRDPFERFQDRRRRQ